jgi:hypothetical protein
MLKDEIKKISIKKDEKKLKSIRLTRQTYNSSHETEKETQNKLLKPNF